MSMLQLSSSVTEQVYQQGFWARMFGAFIDSARSRAGLTVEQASELAGIDAANWSALEAGIWLPTSREQFRSITAALDIEWATMVQIILMCRQAWDIA